MSLSEQMATKLHYSNAFYSGTVAMVVMGEWFPGWMIKGRDSNLLKGFTFNDWAMTRVPCNNADYSTIGVSTFNHVYARSKKKDAAFKFIAWMGSAEAAPVIAKNGFLPAVVNDKTLEVLASSVPDKESLKYWTEKVPIHAQWFHKYGSKLETQVLNPLLSQYLATDMNEGDLLAEIEKACKDVIKSTR